MFLWANGYSRIPPTLNYYCPTLKDTRYSHRIALRDSCPSGVGLNCGWGRDTMTSLLPRFYLLERWNYLQEKTIFTWRKFFLKYIEFYDWIKLNIQNIFLLRFYLLARWSCLQEKSIFTWKEILFLNGLNSMNEKYWTYRAYKSKKFLDEAHFYPKVLHTYYTNIG